MVYFAGEMPVENQTYGRSRDLRQRWCGGWWAGKPGGRHHFPRRRTVNTTPLLATPFTVTTTFPGPNGAWGTPALITLSLQLAMAVAGFPLNVTVLVPSVEPKFAPVIVTVVPWYPERGDKLLMLGVAAYSI